MFSYAIGRRVLLGAVSVLALALFGCGGNSLSKPFGTDPNDTNKERVFNALIGGPSATVDIAQRSTNLNSTPLAFGQSNNYATVSSGIAITTNAFQSGTAIKLAPEASVTMNRDFYYTEVLAGIFGTSGATAPRLIQFSDNFTTPITAGNVELRVVNVSPDSPPISLYNTTGSPPASVAIAGLGNVAYGTESKSGSADYVTAAAGIYTLTVRDNAGNILASLGPVSLAGGHAYSIFVSGMVHPTGSQPGVQASLLTDL